MSIKAAHFYHIWADGAWQTPTIEHIAAITEFCGDVFLGVVGSPENRQDAIALFKRSISDIQVIVEADSGFEQVTLEAMHGWAKEQPAGMPVFYAHTKGADNNNVRHDWWRRYMTHTLTKNATTCIELLEDVDAVGCHWQADGKFFAGNFWWATSGFLASLNAPSTKTRFHAEAWLGHGNPAIADLNPRDPEPINWGVHWDSMTRKLVQEL